MPVSLAQQNKDASESAAFAQFRETTERELASRMVQPLLENLNKDVVDNMAAFVDTKKSPGPITAKMCRSATEITQGRFAEKRAQELAAEALKVATEGGDYLTANVIGLRSKDKAEKVKNKSSSSELDRDRKKKGKTSGDKDDLLQQLHSASIRNLRPLAEQTAAALRKAGFTVTISQGRAPALQDIAGWNRNRWDDDGPETWNLTLTWAEKRETSSRTTGQVDTDDYVRPHQPNFARLWGRSERNFAHLWDLDDRLDN